MSDITNAMKIVQKNIFCNEIRMNLNKKVKRFTSTLKLTIIVHFTPNSELLN